MGINDNARVEDCRHHRKKNHRHLVLNRFELEIERVKEKMKPEDEDVSLWKNGNEKYKEKFWTSDTWRVIREKHQLYDWHKALVQTCNA